MGAALEGFCTANGMTVNLGKPEVVVFNSRWADGGGGRGRGEGTTAAREGEGEGPAAGEGGAIPPFIFNGAPLTRSTSYVYLGLPCTDGEPAKSMLSRAVHKARGAMYGALARCRALDLANVDAVAHLFTSLVQPVLCYGCEVWGPDWIASQISRGSLGSGVAEVKVHLPFLKQVLGVGSSTTAVAMMRELSREPFMCIWLRMSVQL
jgi:hypothetical protein